MRQIVDEADNIPGQASGPAGDPARPAPPAPVPDSTEPVDVDFSGTPTTFDPRAAAEELAPGHGRDLVSQNGPGANAAPPLDPSFGERLLNNLGRSPGAPNPLSAGSPTGIPGAAEPSGMKDPAADGTSTADAGSPDGSPASEKPGPGKKAADAAASAAMNTAADRAGLQAPEGDSALDKAGHLGGQVADRGLGMYLDRFASGAYNAFKKSKVGRALADGLGDTLKEASRRRLPSFVEGERPNGRQAKGGKDRQGEASGPQGSARGKFKMAAFVSFPLLAPVVGVLLIVALLMGAGGSNLDETQTQPASASDADVAEYVPEGWQQVLKQAADQASNYSPDFATVPWTVLAGIVAAQTDFGRYSPYDNNDRDSQRKSKPLPSGRGDGGGGDGSINPDSLRGAGPEPIEGVTGEGGTATVPGSGDHAAPPAGDLSRQLGWFMWALRMHESQGNYTAVSDGGDGTRECRPETTRASGAYQYIRSTWNNYAGYPVACKAPPSVQDRRAIADVMRNWNRYKKWQQVAASHFYPAWAVTPERWDQCPDGCDFNPTVWKYVDGVISKMNQAAQSHPAPRSHPGPGGGMRPSSYDRRPTSPNIRPLPPYVGPAPANVRLASANVRSASDGLRSALGSRRPVRAAVAAADPYGRGPRGCRLAPVKPPIGGNGKEGSGPYLLTPASVSDMRNKGMDPQSPCASSYYVARKLADAAKRVHATPKAPKWVPNGTDKDMENARKYWSRAIDAAGLFVMRGADPDAPCRVPPPDDASKPWSVSFKVIYIWRCETLRMPELYVVTDGKPAEGSFSYEWEKDRASATRLLVNEALSVSYAASGWRTGRGERNEAACDNSRDGREGIFPMTRQEAQEAGVDDRCDVDKNIAGAAKLVLSVEKTPPEERPKDLGVFQPMIGGWQRLGIAMGDDAKLFSAVGPGRSFKASDQCIDVMSAYLKAIAPHATAFAELTQPPGPDKVYDWSDRLRALEKAHGLKDPGSDEACVIGSWAPGFNSTIGQLTVQIADEVGPHKANLAGLGNYYEGRENAIKPRDPVAGKDTLVIPRLAPRPLSEVGAPIASDASAAWSLLGSTEGVAIPLSQIAIEYAWFFGGVIAPFNSAGELIGSLKNGSPGQQGDNGSPQTEVGPDGCPTKVPPRGLRDGVVNDDDRSGALTIQKLCADSVAQARTPEAAKAIKWALSNLGWRYSRSPERNAPNVADCSSFVSRAYRDSGAIRYLYTGNAPTTHTLRVLRWVHAIPFRAAQPGDLVQPHYGHVAMQLANGYKVHTNMESDVSRVDRGYADAVWAGWVDASKV